MTFSQMITLSAVALQRIAALCACALIFMLVIITFVDVIGRQFGHPLAFAFEFTQVTVGMMFYIALPIVTLNREHIIVDLVPINPSSRAALALASAVNILCAVMMAVATIELWKEGQSTQLFKTVMMFTRWPIAPFIFVMSIFAGLTFFVFLGLAAKDFQRIFWPSKFKRGQ